MRRFQDNPDNAPEKQAEYGAKLEGLDVRALFEECRKMIWFSAFASNNPVSCYHWQVKACYAECVRRNLEGVYDNAHKAEMRAAGYGA